VPEERLSAPDPAGKERIGQPARLLALSFSSEVVEPDEAGQRVELVPVLGKVAVDDAGAVGDVAGQAHLGAAVGQGLHVDPELLEERGPVRGVAVRHGGDVA
jgi:hypothetical protein